MSRLGRKCFPRRCHALECEDIGSGFGAGPVCQEQVASLASAKHAFILFSNDIVVIWVLMLHPQHGRPCDNKDFAPDISDHSARIHAKKIDAKQHAKRENIC